MAKKGMKESLKALVSAAEALNGKIFMESEGDLPLLEAFQAAALDAQDALKESEKRAEKKHGQVSGEGDRTTPAGGDVELQVSGQEGDAATDRPADIGPGGEGA